MWKLYYQKESDVSKWIIRKIIEEQERKAAEEDYKMRRRGLCPRHHIFLNCCGKCDMCD